MSTATIKTTTIAWLGSGTYSIREFSAAMHKGDEAAMIGAIAFSPNESMGKGRDAWTRIGTAEITVTIEKHDKIVANTVKALRNQQKALRAEAEVKAVDLERQIQQLLAITNEVAA